MGETYCSWRKKNEEQYYRKFIVKGDIKFLMHFQNQIILNFMKNSAYASTLLTKKKNLPATQQKSLKIDFNLF